MRSLRNSEYDDVDLGVGALRKPVSPRTLVDLLNEQIDRKYPDKESLRGTNRQPKFRQYVRAVELFGEYIAEREAINPVEGDLDAFKTHLLAQAKKGSDKYWGQVVARVRHLFNMIPPNIRQRPLLEGRRQSRATRFDFLVPESREILRRFLADGRRTKMKDGQMILTPKLLTPAVREATVANCLLVLKTVGLDDVLKLRDKHIEQFITSYEVEGKRRETAVHCLCDMSLYRNLMAQGLIAVNPLEGFGEKPTAKVGGFVSEDGIAKLGDLCSLNTHDFIAVRNRLICFGLLYDFGLRRGEAVRIARDAITLDGGRVRLMLPHDAQKGGNKPPVTMWSYFEQTVELVTRYQQMRWAMKINSDAFLINASGKPLLEAGIRGAVRAVCDELDIKTHGNKRPSPHDFRRAFGTLNCQIGLGLSVDDVKDRLRHSSSAVTQQAYIDKNPLVQRQRHEVRVLRSEKKSAEQCGGEVSRAVEFVPGDVITEAAALQALAVHGIKGPGLRKAAEADGAMSRSSGRVHYSKSYVDDLAGSWLRKAECALILGKTIKAFDHWVRLNGIEKRVIGKASLVRIKDVLGERKAQVRREA